MVVADVVAVVVVVVVVMVRDVYIGSHTLTLPDKRSSWIVFYEQVFAKRFEQLRHGLK